MVKWINIFRFLSLIVLILTSIPLYVSYFSGTEPKFSIVTKLHVGFGILFTISAFSSMIINKKMKGNNNAN